MRPKFTVSTVSGARFGDGPALITVFALISMASPAVADDRTKLSWTAELTYETERRRNLADGSENISKLSPELTLEIEHEFSDRLTGVAELNFGHERVLHRGGSSDTRHDTFLEIKALYLEYETERATAWIGRQEFKDDRKWYLDEDLDGIRLVYGRDDWQLEAAAARELLFKMDVLHGDPGEDAVNTYLLRASYDWAENLRTAAYVLGRDGMSGVDEELTFYGLEVRGELKDDFDYWGNLAVLRGRDGEDRLSGVGLDLGGTYQFDHPLQPSLTVAWASGSGDEDETGFRQSGLEGNEARYNGVEDFAYYGEALNPELSNIRIATVGIGVRPTEKSSIDINAHRYWQDVATDGRLSGAAMHAEATGDSRDLGTGVSVIFGYREIEDLALGLRLGWFKPGDAFRDNRTMFSAYAGLDYDF